MMIAPHDPCPTDDALAGFLNERLPADRQAGVGRHIDRCPHCQHRLDTLAADPGGVVERYQQFATVGPHRPTLAGDSGRWRGGASAEVSFDHLPAVPGFEVLSEIGRGGMGVVYRARHVHMNRPCALKVVIAGCAADARTVQRFLFEAEVLARIRHPNVVQVYDVGTYRGPSGVPIPYLAMELLDGGTLAAAANGEARPPRPAAALVEGLAQAVHAVHSQGVIHRDLKPGNILFHVPPGADTEADLIRAAVRGPHAAVAKVSDFGLAKLTEGAGEMTASGLLVGTPGYMAPEQGTPGGRPIGPAADVYALGAILFELLAGRPPFVGTAPMGVMVQVVHDRPPDVRQARPDCPRDLAAVVARCLHKNPDHRYPSAEALADDLARFRADRPTVARPPHPLEVLLMAVRRNPAVAVLTFALLVVTGLGLGLAGGEWRRAERTAVAERDARDRAEEALVEKGVQSRRADGRQLRLELDRAARWCEDGLLDRGMDGFLKALELAERLGDDDLARVIRVNLSAWPARLPPRVRRIPHSDQGPCRAVAYTQDGTKLITAGEYGTLTVWDAATGKPLRLLGTGPLHIRARRPVPTYWGVAVNPAGTRIAAGGSDGQVWVWDADKPWSLAAWPLVGSDADVWAVAFAPDGSLWTGDADGRVRRWEPDTGKLLTELPPADPPAEVQCLVVADAGTRVIAGSRGGLAVEWNVPTGQLLRTYPAGGWVADAAVSACGRLLAVTGTDGRADVWDRITGKKRAGFDLGGAHGNGVAFAPDGIHLAAADSDGNVRVWDRTTGVPAFAPPRVPGAAHPIRFRPGTAELAVPAGLHVGVWRLPPPAGRPLPGDDTGERVRALDFHPSAGTLLVARRHLTVYRADTAAPLRTYPLRTPPLTARFDPIRSRLLRTDRQTWWAVDADTGTETRFDAPAGGYVSHLEPAPLGTTLLTADPRTVFEFDADTGKLIRGLAAGRPSSGSPVRALRYRPDGRELLLATDDRIEFLDPATGDRTRPPIRAEDAVLDARYTADGRRVVAGLRNNAAAVWDVETGRPSDTPMPHALAVTGVAVSPDGAVILTGSRDGTARFWDAATGLPLGPPLRHPGAVVAVAYSGDGTRVATGTVSGSAAVWPVPPPPATGTPAELRAAFAANGVWPDGR